MKLQIQSSNDFSEVMRELSSKDSYNYFIAAKNLIAFKIHHLVIIKTY